MDKAQALAEERAHLESEIAQAKGEAKAKLESRREALRAKQAAQHEKIRQRAHSLQSVWAAKVACIQEKATAAKADVKARHQQHMDRLGKFLTLQKESFKQLFA